MNEQGETRQSDAGNKLLDFLRFSAWRYAANAEWAGAIATSVALSNSSSVTRIAAAGTYGAATYYLENRQTDHAARKMEESYENSDQSPVESPSVVKDGLALAAAAYQGAGAGVELNDSLGLPNTKLRRRVQAAAYAGAITVWASPALSEAGQYGYDQLTENPIRSIVATSIGSVVLKFAVIDRIRGLTHRLSTQTKA